MSERTGDWHQWLREAQEAARPYRSERLDGATEYLLWQTLVGAWPIDEERLQAYATKAVREAKMHTGWSDPDEDYEAAVAAFVTGVLGDDGLRAHVASWVERTADAARAVTLGQKLLQLVVPGVPDVYQGTELVDLSLVDPDNRRAVDFAARTERLRAARRRRGATRPRRREAARHQPGPAPAARASRVVHRSRRRRSARRGPTASTPTPSPVATPPATRSSRW